MVAHIPGNMYFWLSAVNSWLTSGSLNSSCAAFEWASTSSDRKGSTVSVARR